MIESRNHISFSFAKRHGALLLGDKIVCLNNIDLSIVAELQRVFGVDFELSFVEEDEFNKLLAEHYAGSANQVIPLFDDFSGDLDLDALVDGLPKSEELLEADQDAPIIKLINALFSQAIRQQASDIHLETFEKKLIVRFRIDGVLREVLEPPRLIAPLLVSRIKIMAKLDIAEKRLPQDGRIGLKIAGHPVDVRVSTLPASYGERVVMRILDKNSARLDLDHLGMGNRTLHLMRQLIHRPSGIVLVTGPTGSGKTTTLYAALTELNQPERNILTVEDPIEYYLPGIGQTQVNHKIDMSFARGLRAILRQDPDVVMVGEIRDLETAKIAVQASLTGHLVFATLHTNSALGAVTRLRDMGIETFLLSTSLVGATAQRLVRVLCNNCKEKRRISATEREVLGDTAPDEIYHQVGCDKCNHTGFKGRTGIYEVIGVDDALQNMIHDNAGELEMERYVRQNFASMLEDGFSKVKQGITTLEEVLRVAAST
ncbi:MAG: type II secretion system ATPase GspE [Gammaproteobacteria bacterium]|nr:type II secretion system ATPase GspE [Gammaproteobacteria bacterium]